MNVQIYLNIYDNKFGRLKKRLYLCIVDVVNIYRKQGMSALLV